MINMEEVEFTTEEDMPEDFPANNREARIANIYGLLSKLPKQPDYKIKEVLASICIETDLNEKDSRGLLRITEYEISLINSIYILASQLHAEFIKIYLYREIITLEMQLRMGNNMKKQFGLPVDDEMNTIGGLIPMLKLFYVFYSNYKANRSRSFIDEVINSYNLFISLTDDEDLIFERTKNTVSMLLDLSYVDSYKTFPTLKFDKHELMKMFEFVATILKRTCQNPSERPLFGVLCIMISNYILKSRNNYNQEHLYKCLSDTVLGQALDNFQVWMNKTSNLNDKREGKVLIDLFANKNWINVEWAKKTNLRDRSSYVASFVKGMPIDRVKKRYGGNLLGYKNDKIAASLSPFSVQKKYGLMLGHVVTYDILYSRKEAKEELNYLFSVIDLFNCTEKEKIRMLEEILPYWKYSFKDSRWKEEKERRYEILYFDSCDYIESELQNDFFKLKTALFNFPDIALVKNNKQLLLSRRMEKLNYSTVKEYQFCNDCLSSDFDNVSSNSCLVCGSTSVKILNKKVENN